MAIRTYGTMGVDWEQRIDFDRLRRDRLARITALLAKSELGALLCFDMNNVRYITSTHIGTWAQDKISRFTLLPQRDEPILWDFGSAAKHHQLNCPWLGDRSRAGIALLRGAMTPEMGRAEDVAGKIRVELESRGLLNDPVGVDVVEPPILFALQKEGVRVVDGQQLMSDAREIKTADEISLLAHSAMMVDAAYDELYRAMRPGLRENECVGLVSKTRAARIRTSSRIACCVPAIRSITTSCTRTWAIGPAITAASQSISRRTRSSTRTNGAAIIWTRRSS